MCYTAERKRDDIFVSVNLHNIWREILHDIWRIFQGAKNFFPK
jgi:hypothetical protein